jgi:RNA methyltransferase, TrmH family
VSQSIKLGKHSPKWKEWLELKNPRKRRLAKKMLIEGTRLLEELLVSPCAVDCLLFCSELIDDRSLQLLEMFEGSKFETEKDSLQRLSEMETSPGMLAVGLQPDEQQYCVEQFDSILILEGLSDPGNIGTLIRTARAAGVSAVICNGGADPYSSKTIRASAGAIFNLPVLENRNLHDLIRQGFTLIETVVEGGRCIYSAGFEGKVAWVLGNESRGVSTAEVAAQRITIPMENSCESLNVATAGAILMYEWKRRRL